MTNYFPGGDNDELIRSAPLVPVRPMPVASATVWNSAGEELAQSLFRRRAILGSNLNEVNTNPFNRDIWGQVGYPQYIDKYQYQRMYDRNPVAHRVVELYPLECWQQLPTIYDSDAPTQSEFEKKVNEVFSKTNMWGFLRRIDILSGIGCYGILLLGVGDGKPLSEPVVRTPDQSYDLTYVRAFPHSQVEIMATEMDRTSPRYGWPTKYQIRSQGFEQTDMEGGLVDLTMQEVHWTRIVHIADNRLVSEIFGVPRLQCCYNALLDLEKIFASSGEMFYKGAYPPYVISGIGTVPSVS